MPSKTIVDFAYQVRDYMRSAEVVEGKNLAENKNVHLISGETVGNTTFSSVTNTAIVAKLEHNTDYVASHASGYSNARFRLALSESYPVAGGECYTVVNDTSLTDYQFNSGNYNYALLHCASSEVSLETVQGMICTLAEWEKSHTYEPYYVPVKDKIKGKSYTLINNKLFAELRGNIVSLESPPSQSMTCAEVLAVTIPAEICPAHDIIITGYVISGSNRLLGVFNVYSNGKISCGKNYNNGYADCADSDIVKFYCTYAI